MARLKIKPREKALASAWLVAATLYFGLRYDINFVADGWPDSTRRLAAQTLGSQQTTSHNLAVFAEPAPYCLPPVDLFHWQVVLLPRSASATVPGQISVRPVDEISVAPIEKELIHSRTEPLRPASPISWANKPFEIFRVK